MIVKRRGGFRVGLIFLIASLSCDSGSRRTDGGLEGGSGVDAGFDASRPGMDAGDAGPGARDTGGSGSADSGPDEGGLADTGALDAGSPSCTGAPDVSGLALELVPGVGTLSRLVFAIQAPGADDWYLVQQTGTIRVLSNGQLRAANFLDTNSNPDNAIGALSEPGDERGLLGLAFAPDYATSGKFYVALTPTAGANANRDLVLEYRRSAADPYVADTSTAKPILELEASPPNHNGGHVAFGPDGMLYVGTGDGGGGCNNFMFGGPQLTNSPFGKILRLDPNAPPPYAASGNPFASGGDARVLHYGLRNPFRFNFDRGTGDLYIGDVGQVSYEELDRAAAGRAGLNFGWAAFEGEHLAPPSCMTDAVLRSGSTHTEPIVEIDRRMMPSDPAFGDWVSIIAGVTYRGQALPKLTGVHVFGDYTGARMLALRQCGDQTSPPATLRKNDDPNNPAEAGFRTPAGFTFRELTAIVEDHQGELYFVANRSTLVKVVARP